MWDMVIRAEVQLQSDESLRGFACFERACVCVYFDFRVFFMGNESYYFIINTPDNSKVYAAFTANRTLDIRERVRVSARFKDTGQAEVIREILLLFRDAYREIWINEKPGVGKAMVPRPYASGEPPPLVLALNKYPPTDV